MNKDNYLVTDEHTYLRRLNGTCSDCDIPSYLCSRVKCKDKYNRYNWKDVTDEFNKFLKEKLNNEKNN